MNKNEFTHIIRKIVTEEIRKELPNAIAEIFQNFMGQKSVVTEKVIPPHLKPEPKEDEMNLKQSLREMFAGTKIMSNPQTLMMPKHFTKDPKLNEILNQTRPFTPQERMGAPGTAAMMAATQAGVALPGTVPDFSVPAIPQAQLLKDDHVPLAELPEGVSVLDVKEYIPPVVAEALTRDYSKILKLIDKKKGKVA